MIRALFNTRTYVDLVVASTRMFENWDAIVGGNAGFVQQGFLRITNTLDAAAIGGDLDLTRKAGEPFQMLTTEELSQLVPTGTFQKEEIGILFPTGGYADPFRTTVELADAARRHGAEIREGVQVTDIRVDGGCVTAVETDSGTIATPLVVNCAGSWSDRIAAMAGVQLPILIQPAPTCLFRRPDSMTTIGPILSDGVNQVYLRAMGDAVYRAAHFGLSAEIVDPDNFDDTVPAGQARMLKEGLGNRHDALQRAPSLGGFTALYAMTPDGHPIVGPIEDVKGFWCDCGWSGNGFAPAPAGGRSLAQMIIGSAPDIDLGHFCWPRSADVSKRVNRDWIHD